jgi:hypothetical protein
LSGVGDAIACYQAATARRSRFAAACALALAIATTCSSAFAVDLTFNITYIGEATHTGSPQTDLFYAEVWGEGNYAYVGSNQVGQGVSIFDISTPSSPRSAERVRPSVRPG